MSELHEGHGLPALDEALYWIYKCVAAPRGGAAATSPDSVRKAFDRWREGKPFRTRTAYKNAKAHLRATPGVGKRGASEFARFADEYPRVRTLAKEAPRSVALWETLESVLLPLWADRATDLSSRNYALGYIMGRDNPCPVLCARNVDKSLAANLWYLPTHEKQGWDTPVAKVLRRAFALTSTNPNKFARFAADNASSDTDGDPYTAWKQQLHRWMRPWRADDDVIQRPPIPHPDSIHMFVDLLAEMTRSDDETRSISSSNIFQHFIQTSALEQYEYIRSSYATHSPEGLPFVENIGISITERFRTFAIQQGRLTPGRLRGALVIARGVQTACFGSEPRMTGLHQLSVSRWDASNVDASNVDASNADENMSALLETYRHGVEARMTQGLSVRLSLNDLLEESAPNG